MVNSLNPQKIGLPAPWRMSRYVDSLHRLGVASFFSFLIFFSSSLFFFFSSLFFFPFSHFTCSFFMHDCIATTNTTRTTPWNTMLQVIWTLYSQIPALASQQAVMKVRKSSAIPPFFLSSAPSFPLFFFSVARN